MSKYGYNPDEHFQTKVTLIDKDGFHKESDEVPSEGSGDHYSNGLILNEGLYFYKNKFYDNGVCAIMVFGKENYPELFEFDVAPIEIYGAQIYFGDAINDADITVDADSYNAFYNGVAIGAGVGFNSGYISNGSCYIDDALIYGVFDNDPHSDRNNIEEGTPVHAVCVIYKDDQTIFVKQIHSTWHIINA